MSTTPTSTSPSAAPSPSPSPETGQRPLRDRFRWIFSETGIVLLILFVIVPVAAYLSHVEEKADDDWVAEAPQVEQALNDFYVDDISYDRELLSRGRGLHVTEIAAVNGEVRTDCIAVVWKTGDTITAAGLTCEEPIEMTVEPGATLPTGEPAPTRP